jgi:hypothetical protein
MQEGKVYESTKTTNDQNTEAESIKRTDWRHTSKDFNIGANKAVWVKQWDPGLRAYLYKIEAVDCFLSGLWGSA